MASTDNLGDFRLTDCGSIVALTPLTSEAEEWLNDNVHSEAWQWMGSSLCIEPRYAMDIAAGMDRDGFTIELAN